MDPHLGTGRHHRPRQCRVAQPRFVQQRVQRGIPADNRLLATHPVTSLSASGLLAVADRDALLITL
jgi:hypothetical protein